MTPWYEIFDNEQVQYATRRHAAMLTAMVIGMIGLTASGFAVSHAGLVPLPMMGVLLTAAWFFTLHVIIGRMRHLRRIVWCVKLSERKIVGYDYTRRRTIIDWLKVRRIDLAASGLVVVGADAASLEIPHLFPDFARLSHLVVQYADAYGVPIFVDGQPWQNLNVYELFPFLEEAVHH